MGVAAAFCAPVLLAAAVPAFAHAELVKAEPADGAVLTTPPRRILLTFSEPVSPLLLQLILPSDQQVALPFVVRGNTIWADLPDGLGVGTHIASWRVASEDGHPVGGAVLFSIARPTNPSMSLGAIDDWPLRFSIWIVKLVLYVGLFAGVGGAFFRAWMDSAVDPPPRHMGGLLVAGLLAAIVSLALQGLDGLGRPLSEFADKATWQTGLRTSFATTVAVAIMSFSAALASLRSSRPPVARAWSLLALIGVGLALAASGHASAAAPQWLTRPAVFVHGIAIAAWAGALVPLMVLLRGDPLRAARPMERFSRFIPVAVAALAVAGLALAIVQVETPAALLTTDYGILLLAKLAVLAPIFVLAGINRWMLTAPVMAGDPAAIRRLARNIGIEMLLIACVFGIATAWRFTPPPRSLSAAHSSTMVHIHTPRAMAELTLRPDAPGPVSASILVQTGDFEPLTPKEVTLFLSMPSAGIEPIRRAALPNGDGTWRVEGLVVPVPGYWQVRIDILISDFEIVTLEQPIKFGLR